MEKKHAYQEKKKKQEYFIQIKENKSIFIWNFGWKKFGGPATEENYQKQINNLSEITQYYYKGMKFEELKFTLEDQRVKLENIIKIIDEDRINDPLKLKGNNYCDLLPDNLDDGKEDFDIDDISLDNLEGTKITKKVQITYMMIARILYEVVTYIKRCNEAFGDISSLAMFVNFSMDMMFKIMLWVVGIFEVVATIKIVAYTGYASVYLIKSLRQNGDDDLSKALKSENFGMSLGYFILAVFQLFLATTEVK